MPLLPFVSRASILPRLILPRLRLDIEGKKTCSTSPPFESCRANRLPSLERMVPERALLQNSWHDSTTPIPDRFESETWISGTFNSRICTSTSAICHATLFCLMERCPSTYASCGRQRLTVKYKKPFAASGSHNLLQCCPTAYANGSDPEAANFLVVSANDLP